MHKGIYPKLGKLLFFRMLIIASIDAENSRFFLDRDSNDRIYWHRGGETCLTPGGVRH